MSDTGEASKIKYAATKPVSKQIIAINRVLIFILIIFTTDQGTPGRTQVVRQRILPWMGRRFIVVRHMRTNK